MEKEKENVNNNISLDDLYGYLRDIDLSIIKKLAKKEIDDYSYIMCGVLSDLISNAKSLLINKLSANIDSIGVDVNCKNIIECICVLKMISSGKVSLGKAKIYRYLYPYSHEENISAILEGYDNGSKVYKDLLLAREKSVEVIKEVFKWSDEVANKRVLDINCNYGYLKDKTSDIIDMNKVLEENPIYDENKNKAYKFFTTSIYPRYEVDSNLKLQYSQLRNKNIDIVIDYLMKYLAENKLINYNEEIVNFSKDFINNPFFKTNIDNASWINGTFEYIKDNFAVLNSKKDDYLTDYFMKLNSLCIDIYFCFSLGLTEQVINKFIAFFFFFIVNLFINSANDGGKALLKKALCARSRLSLEEYLKETKSSLKFPYENELKDVFEVYYKNKYNLPYNEFKNKMAKDPFFLLSKENDSSFAIAKSMLTKMYSNDKRANFFITMYKIAIDFSHSSKYTFDVERLLIDLLSIRATQVVYEYMDELVKYLENKYKELGIKVNSKDVSAIFKELIKSDDDLVKDDIKYFVSMFKV